METTDQLASRLSHLVEPADARALLEHSVGDEISLLDSLAGPGGLKPFLTWEALLSFYGHRLLFAKEIRQAIIRKLTDPEIDELWTRLAIAGDGTVPKLGDKRTILLGTSIAQGSARARRLCEFLELPYSCAGDVEVDDAPSLEVIPPYIELRPLHTFQRELAEAVRTQLLAGPGHIRAMLALPTGGGKTRVVLETLLDWEPIERGAGCLIWVAQHEHLCEQAIACMREIWAAKPRPLNRFFKIQRVWDGKSEEIDWSADAIVGIPESLASRLPGDVKSAGARLKISVIDEAHLSMSDKYDKVFYTSSTTKTPLLGISATPENSAAPNGPLQKVFKGKLLSAPSLGDAPLQALRDMKVLSDLKFESIETGLKITLSEEEKYEIGDSGDFSKQTLKRIGRSVARNTAIIDRLRETPPKVATLCFASSVASARVLAAGMSVSGRKSAVIDANTHPATRRDIIEAFRSGAIQFLFNYGVLATGFDAPNIECLVIARPTRNQVLLEQMIGRGLRGPANGGTRECLLLWIQDDFENAGHLEPLGYSRFANLWS